MARAKDARRMLTQRQQRISDKTGTASPRHLARGIARAMRKKQGAKGSEIKAWRQMIAQLPEKGNKYLHRRVANG